jgi:hypothetical protein
MKTINYIIGTLIGIGMFALAMFAFGQVLLSLFVNGAG